MKESTVADLDAMTPGDVVLRPQRSPLVYDRAVTTTWMGRTIAKTWVFRDLETWAEVIVHSQFTDDLLQVKRWTFLKRSHQPSPSDSVGSITGENETPSADGDGIMTQQNLASTDSATDPSSTQSKTKRSRTVDYTRTDKRPHSFRYKRHSTFVTRSGAVSLSKEADGALVIGPAPEGSMADAAKLEAGTLELVSVKKRPNGKTAIAFSHPELGVVVAYDARAARAALRAG